MPNSAARIVNRSILPASAGLLAGAAGLAIAHLLAQFGDPNASPIIAVGGAAIDATPTPVKEWAIRQFGTNDKHILLGGIIVVLALLTMLIGILAARRFRVGAAGVALLGAVAVAAELGRPNVTFWYPVPTVVGLMCAVALLYLQLRMLRAVDKPSAEPVPSGGSAAADATHSGAAGSPGSRRRFLLTGAGIGIGAAAALTAGNELNSRSGAIAARRRVRLPAPASPAKPLPAGVDLRIPGLTPFVTANSDFYRVDTALVTPQVNPNSWSLKIDGMVRTPLRIGYAELLAMPMIERDITLTCVSNDVGGPYVSSARWLGVPLVTLFERAGIDPAADQLFSTSTDGFTTSTPTRLALDGRDAMIAVGMNGEPLPAAHGFPARMIVPGLYGYVSGCKWLRSITATTYRQRQAYWTQRGWDINGPIYTETRIDVPASLSTVRAGTVPIAGVAWAQHRGIERVEVSIDGGPWQQATLSAADGLDTWRQWFFRWQATPGSHQIRARATDGSGQVQTDKRQPVFPRGATGIQETVVTVQ